MSSPAFSRSRAISRTFGVVLFASRSRVSFRSFAADVRVGAEHRGNAGAYIALQNRGRETWFFKVYRDRDGKLHWEGLVANKNEHGLIGATVAPGEPFRVDFRVDREPVQPVLQVWVNGAIVFAQAISNLRNPTGQMAIGLFVETANALAVDASLDQVDLVYSQS